MSAREGIGSQFLYRSCFSVAIVSVDQAIRRPSALCLTYLRVSDPTIRADELRSWTGRGFMTDGLEAKRDLDCVVDDNHAYRKVRMRGTIHQFGLKRCGRFLEDRW